MSSILNKIEVASPLVQIFGAQSKLCANVLNNTSAYKVVGKGTRGVVLALPNGKRKVVKLSYADYEIYTVIHPNTTVESYAKHAEETWGIPAAVTISLNRAIGLNPEKELSKGTHIIAPTFAKMLLRLIPTLVKCNFAAYTGRPTRASPSVVLQKNSYILPSKTYYAEEDIYSDFINGSLCGHLYNSGRSINFIAVHEFATCAPTPPLTVVPTRIGGHRPPGVKAEPDISLGSPKARQYIMMDQIDNNVSSIMPCLLGAGGSPRHAQIYDRLAPYIERITESVMIQTLHAIAMYQTEFALSHNDLHYANLFIEYVTAETTWRGEYLIDRDYFVLGDFGMSCKYTTPMVLQKYVMQDAFRESAYVPNWFAPAYDLLMVADFFAAQAPNNRLAQELLGAVVGKNLATLKGTTIQALRKSNAEIKATVFGFPPGGSENTSRPKLPQLWTNTATAVEILRGPLFSKYKKKPLRGREIVLGRCHGIMPQVSAMCKRDPPKTGVRRSAALR